MDHLLGTSAEAWQQLLVEHKLAMPPITVAAVAIAAFVALLYYSVRQVLFY